MPTSKKQIIIKNKNIAFESHLCARLETLAAEKQMSFCTLVRIAAEEYLDRVREQDRKVFEAALKETQVRHGGAMRKLSQL